MTLLDGKAAIVTGSAHGIGRAVAELLAEQGAAVLITDVDREAAELTAKEIGGDVAVHAGDITAPGELVSAALDVRGARRALQHDIGLGGAAVVTIYQAVNQ